MIKRQLEEGCLDIDKKYRSTRNDDSEHGHSIKKLSINDIIRGDFIKKLKATLKIEIQQLRVRNMLDKYEYQ